MLGHISSLRFVGDQEFGLDPHSFDKAMRGPIGYWPVANIEKSLPALLEAGARAQQAVRDVGGGKLIASVEDADGKVIGLIQPP